MSNQQTLHERAINALFDPTDYVWVTSRLDGVVYSRPVAEAMKFLGRSAPSGVWMCGNPAKGPDLARGNQNAIQRTMLIEFDKYPAGHALAGQPIPLEEQDRIMAESGIPWTTKVFSGSKSYHFLIRLACPQKDDVKKLFLHVSAVLGKMNDLACHDPARWSRYPGAIRGDVPQEILEVRSAVTVSKLTQVLSTLQAQAAVAADGVMLKQHSNFHNWAPKEEGDRSGIIEMLDWYCEQHDIEYVPSGVSLPCPACRAEGGDNHGDNFRIYGDEYATKCWAGDSEHSREALRILFKMWSDDVGHNRWHPVDVEKAYGNRKLGEVLRALLR